MKRIALSLALSAVSACGQMISPKQILGPTPGVLNADSFPGDDICQKITAAYASVANSPSAIVKLGSARNYTCSGIYTHPSATSAPFISTPWLDMNNSQITMTSTALAPFVIPARNGGVNGSGGIMSGHITIQNPGSELRFESATYFSFVNMTLTVNGSSGSPTRGMDWVNVNSAAFGGSGGYFEDNQISIQQADSPQYGCFMTLRQDPSLTGGAGSGSFFYNRKFHMVHYSGNSSTAKGVCMETAPSGLPNPIADGIELTASLNGGGTFIDLQDGTVMRRGWLGTTGEQNIYAANLIAVHGTSSMLNLDGFNNAQWGYSYDGGAHEDQIRIGKSITGTNLASAYPYPYSQPINPEVTASSRENVGRNLSNQDKNLIALPNYEGACNGTGAIGDESPWWQIGYRTTKGGYGVLENNPVGAYGDTAFHNSMFALPGLCKGISFRKGIHDLPQNASPGAFVYTVPFPTDNYGPNEAWGNLSVPSTAYASGSSGPPASEWGVKSSGSTIDQYKLGTLNVHDVTAGKNGTAYTGDIVLGSDTLHVVAGLITGVN